jgi:ABC transporter substrate binding protein
LRLGCGLLPSGLLDCIRESLDVVAVGSWNEVTVEVDGDLDRGVPELLRDVGDGHPAAEHQRDIGVAGVVDADVTDFGFSMSGLHTRSRNHASFIGLSESVAERKIHGDIAAPSTTAWAWRIERDMMVTPVTFPPGRARLARAGALIAVADPVTDMYRTRIADFALRNRLPATYYFKAFAEAGGLLAYGANLADLFRRAATYVDKILKGAKPADLPVEQPRKFELVINLKTAKALGLTIPQSVLIRADEVIR